MTLALDRRIIIHLNRCAPRYGLDHENLVADGQLAILLAERRGVLAGDDAPARSLACLIGRRAMAHTGLSVGRNGGRDLRYARTRPKWEIPPDLELLDVPALLRRLGPEVGPWIWRHYGMGETWIEMEANTGIGAEALKHRCHRALAKLRCSLRSS